MPNPTNKIAPHPVEAQNRLDKAQRMVEFLDTHVPNATARQLSMLDDAAWLRFNHLMGEKLPPSKALVSTVIALVRGREMAIDAVRGALKR